MCENQRALISKVKIDDNGATHVYYSFSPTRAKFWMGFAATFLVLAGMMVAVKDGAYNAVEDFVATKCGEYLAIFHEEVRPLLEERRTEDINAAIAIHTTETSAEYATNIHKIQMEQAREIGEIKIEQSAQGATLRQMQVNEVQQTHMLQELISRRSE